MTKCAKTCCSIVTLGFFTAMGTTITVAGSALITGSNLLEHNEISSNPYFKYGVGSAALLLGTTLTIMGGAMATANQYDSDNDSEQNYSTNP